MPTASDRPEPIDVEGETVTVSIEVGDVPVVDHGEGPPVFMLHGFPDSRRLWRYQVPALADAGFRVIAPDLRGFGDAPKPDGVESYALSETMGDAVELLDAMGLGSVRLVGHDWGAALAWLLAAYHGDRVDQLAALSVGAPGGEPRGIQQREKSWYIYFFQFEGVAEEWLRRDGWALFREWSRGDGDTERYVEDLSRPGALTAALNWYRANARPGPPGERTGFPGVSCPTLGVWSDGDNYLVEDRMTDSEDRVDGPWRYERVTGVSHWFMLDEPGEVNDLLLGAFEG